MAAIDNDSLERGKPAAIRKICLGLVLQQMLEKLNRVTEHRPMNRRGPLHFEVGVRSLLEQRPACLNVPLFKCDSKRWNPRLVLGIDLSAMVQQQGNQAGVIASGGEVHRGVSILAPGIDVQ